MTLIINAGSAIGATEAGWTNTEAQARKEAEKWLALIHADGMVDVELLPGSVEFESRWRFTFRHAVTAVEVTFETHGIDNEEVYRKRYTFAPRQYWNGSSTNDPEIDDFAAPGFAVRKTFVPAALKGENQ